MAINWNKKFTAVKTWGAGLGGLFLLTLILEHKIFSGNLPLFQDILLAIFAFLLIPIFLLILYWPQKRLETNFNLSTDLPSQPNRSAGNQKKALFVVIGIFIAYQLISSFYIGNKKVEIKRIAEQIRVQESNKEIERVNNLSAQVLKEAAAQQERIFFNEKYQEFLALPKGGRDADGIRWSFREEGWRSWIRFNLQQDLRRWEQGAINGNAFANFVLGYDRSLYSTNAYEIIDYYTKAADQGFVLAQCELGKLFMRGDIVESNAVLAVDYFNSAANAGDPIAQYYLGRAYELGNGVAIDLHRANNLYFESSRHGYQFGINCYIMLAMKLGREPQLVWQMTNSPLGAPQPTELELARASAEKHIKFLQDLRDEDEKKYNEVIALSEKIGAQHADLVNPDPTTQYMYMQMLHKTKPTIR